MLEQAVNTRALVVEDDPNIVDLIRSNLAVRGFDTVVSTDGLRALLLEMHGYRANVFEFISPEATSKNLMLAAHRRTQPVDSDALRRRFRELCEFYGLREQQLAKLLGE